MGEPLKCLKTLLLSSGKAWPGPRGNTSLHLPRTSEMNLAMDESFWVVGRMFQTQHSVMLSEVVAPNKMKLEKDTRKVFFLVKKKIVLVHDGRVA